jgi:tripartite-type tricarboxylate transporter receptor subunit TctC
MSLRLRTLIAAVLSLLLALPALAQQRWPARPMKILVPFPPGGTSDLIGRLLAQRLQDALGQPVIVENRTGAGGMIATDAVAKSPPDGYTLLIAITGPYITAPLLQKTPYDTLRDFVAISNININPQVLLVHPSAEVSSVRDLIALAKARPGKLNIATAGPGSLTEVSAVMFNHMASVQTTLVPYRGGAPDVAAVLSGDAYATYVQPSDAIPQVKAGKLRALAVTGAKRFPQLPNVPTVAESGLPGFVVETMNGVVAPAGTPPEIVNRISGLIQQFANDPAMRERMADVGLTAIGDTPEQFRAFVEAQVEFWAKFIRESGLKAAAQ